MLTHVDAFTGVGGFTYALRGVSVPGVFCDIDTASQTVLQNLMRKGKLPKAPIVADIKDLSKAITFKPDILTSGWPCTGHSTAGKKEGLENIESALFFHIVKLARVHRPRLIILENVPGVASPAIISRIIPPFVRLGYSVRWTLVPAYAVGLPHKRLRWFCVCYTDLALLRRVAAGMKQVHRKEPPRNVPVREAHYTRRWHLLGMSVVPACIVAAVKHMAAAPGNGFCEYPIPPMPDLKLTLRQGPTVIYKRLWPTPRTVSGASVVLNERVAKDMPTTVRWEEKSTSRYTSFDWLDWLMGYPKGWTEL